MSNSSPASGAKTTPKSMSSRLLTMKFMQRAAASSPTGSASSSSSRAQYSPASESRGHGDADSELRSPKRSKLSHRPSQAVDSEPVASTRPVDVRTALLGAEATRQAALERSWRGEETRWSFAVREDPDDPVEGEFRVEMLRGRAVDGGEGDDAVRATTDWRTEEGSGRMTFGSKRKNTSTKQEKPEEDSDASSESDDSEDSFDAQVQEVLSQPDYRSSSRTNGADRRPGRISGGIQDVDRIQCHGCQEFGHVSRNCPNKWKNKQRQPMGSRRSG